MQQLTATITPIHYLYLIGVITILLAMIARKDTPLICVVFLFLLGVFGTGTIYGGVQSLFRAIVYATIQFMDIIATIALVIALSKALEALGSDRLLVKPFSKIMKTPYLTWWILGITMLVFSLFLWPSPAVALLGAIMIPVAVKKGLTPLACAMAMNLFGHGIGLSCDFVIQGAPAVSASAANIPTQDIITEGMPLFLVMAISTVIFAFLLNRKTMYNKQIATNFANEEAETTPASKSAIFIAILTPLAFLTDIVLMLIFGIRGGDATGLVAGTALLLMIIGAILKFGKNSLSKTTQYLTDGFLFSIRIFAPVIVIGAFFFVGGDGITTIIDAKYTQGIMTDWAIWLSNIAPLNTYCIAFMQMVIGMLTGLDGSGFSGLPLTGSLAHTFGIAQGISVPRLAALGQICAIFVGGGTLVPWGLIPVAAICNVDPIELARKNFAPVMLGFLCTFILACFLL